MKRQFKHTDVHAHSQYQVYTNIGAQVRDLNAKANASVRLILGLATGYRVQQMSNDTLVDCLSKVS